MKGSYARDTKKIRSGVPRRRGEDRDRDRQLRKVTKNRGHFPNERAALKLLYLAVRNITTTRGGTAGTGTQGWTECINQLAIRYPGRLPLT